MTNDFLRLQSNPPASAPPQQGQVDIIYDSEAESFVKRLPDGTTETIGGGSGEVTQADITAAKARANHTGVQAISTVTGLQPALDAKLPAINVKAAPYNAVGDGVVDDTSAIQAALDAAGASDTASSTIYFPAGTYKITADIQIPRAGLTLFGDGQLSSIINQVTASEHAVTWDTSVNSQFTCIRHLGFTGVGGDTSTKSGLHMRRDSPAGNFFASQFIIEDVGVTGFLDGIRAENTPKVVIRDCKFSNNACAVRLTKSDTFIISNASAGAAGVTATSYGIIIENSAGSPSGGNFGGIIELGEFGDLDRFIDLSGGGKVTVIEPNVERCGEAANQACVYITGTASMKWCGGRLSNGSGASTTAYFRLYGDSGGDVPNLHFFGTPSFDGGSIRRVECFGGLGNKCGLSGLGSGLIEVTYATTAGGAANNVGFVSPLGTYGSVNSMGSAASNQGQMAVIPSTTAETNALITARNPAGTYARRQLINDRLIHVMNDTATVATNTSTGATTIYTYQVPSNTIGSTKQSIRVRAFGKFAANSNNKRIQIDWGNGIAIYDSTALAINDNDWSLDIVLIYTASGNWSARVKADCDDALFVNKLQVTKTIARFSNTNNTINIVATGGATADVELLWAQTQWMKNDSEY